MKIIACQLDIAWEDKQANYDRVSRLVEEARPEPGSLFVLPEMFATGFSMNVARIAEPKEGPTLEFLCGVSRRYGIFTLGGVVTKGRAGKGRNEAICCGPEGETLARYAKLHPFGFAGETQHYEPGEAIEIFEWRDFRAAPFVCYDLRFPEAFREAVRAGAELMIVIANWPQARESHWLALLCARAIENLCYVVGVNRAGDDPNAHYGGHSLILGPRGESLAEAGEGQQLIAADVELEPLVAYRQKFPALADIRNDFFAR